MPLAAVASLLFTSRQSCRPRLARAGKAARRRAAIVAMLCVLCSGALTGCVSTRTMGDRALEEKRYSEALDLYEQEIAEGSRDPELYYNAAQASLYEGDLGGAERYYSRAIKYGGGLKVMRALAQLYIETSNYARAAQVLYELLRLDPERQTIYTNLGTALLYSGQPSEAESYLLIAQQLDPADPVPYINLAVIYDRYLTDPAKSAAFYDCYSRLAPANSPHHATALSRSKELKAKASVLSSSESFPLRCGEVYVPGDYKVEADRRAKLEALKRKAQLEDQELFGEEVAPEKNTAPDHEAPTPQGLDDEASSYEQAPSPPLTRAEVEHLEASLSTVSREMKECEAVLSDPALEKGASSQLSASSLQVLATCYQSVQRPRKAETTWLMVLKKKPSSIALSALLQLMDTAQREDEIRSLCDEYRDHVTTVSAVQKCQEVR